LRLIINRDVSDTG